MPDIQLPRLQAIGWIEVEQNGLPLSASFFRCLGGLQLLLNIDWRFLLPLLPLKVTEIPTGFI